jgi:hypothetical protein
MITFLGQCQTSDRNIINARVFQNYAGISTLVEIRRRMSGEAWVLGLISNTSDGIWGERRKMEKHAVSTSCPKLQESNLGFYCLV